MWILQMGNTGAKLISLDGEESVKTLLYQGNIVEVSLENGKPSFKIKVKMQADISEIRGGVSSAMEIQDIERIKLSGEKYIENETKKLLDSLYNEYNSDSVGLARLLYICEKEFFKKTK